MTIKEKIFLLIIIFLGLTTRLVRLDYAPPSLSNDEISIAYDAYSVSETGKDEHGNFLPISFQSYNTYKAPLTAYLDILSIKIFGNNEYGARIPSAVLGLGTILFLGLLIWELTKNKQLALISAFVLTITPWHIFTSRMAWESNVALFFVVLMIYGLMSGIKKQNNWLVLLGFVSGAISIYGYHTEWVFSPMIIATIWLLNRKICFKKPIFYIGLVLFGLLVLPVFINYVKHPDDTRAGTQMIWTDRILEQKLKNKNIGQKIILIGDTFLSNYSGYLDNSYLFFNGLNLLKVQDPFQVGLFLVIFLPAFWIGIINVKNYFEKDYKFIYWWAILGPVIPSLTSGGSLYIRNLVSVVPYAVLIAIGSLTIWERFFKKRLGKILLGILVGLSFIYFLTVYFYHFPRMMGENFQDGYKQVAEFIKENDQNYDKIIIDPRFGAVNLYAGVPHLYIGYFAKIDPKIIQNRVYGDKWWGFGKFEFRDINWNLEEIKPNYLYVAPFDNKLENKAIDELITIKEIRLLNNKPEFYLYEKRPDLIDKIRVIDGDTIEVTVDNKKESVRLIGINAPELTDSSEKGKLAVESKEYLKKLLQNKNIRLEKDTTQDDRDIYGRLLRYVFLEDGTLVNKKMIEAGMADEYTFKKPYKYQKEFKEAEKGN
jgi:4-amino-4-deoxy-L-arabinose transferase-like glycosyltransferase